MAVRVAGQLLAALGELRYEPTAKRVRAVLGDEPVVDSTRAVLVWEPQRVVPQYAVPVEDVLAELLPGQPGDGAASGELVRLGTDGPFVLTPAVPFGVHSSDGDVLTVRAAGGQRASAAFRLADPDLAGHVVLDFAAFDRWFEEEEPILAHPRDPFTRIDVRRSARHVRIEHDGRILAESSRPRLLFETHLPVRFYLPPEDVRADLLLPSRTVTACAYKGEASYWSFEANGERVDDLAWTYEEPLPDCAALAGLIAFFDDLVDVTVDGERRARPSDALAASILEEVGL